MPNAWAKALFSGTSLTAYLGGLAFLSRFCFGCVNGTLLIWVKDQRRHFSLWDKRAFVGDRSKLGGQGYCTTPQKSHFKRETERRMRLFGERKWILDRGLLEFSIMTNSQHTAHLAPAPLAEASRLYQQIACLMMWRPDLLDCALSALSTRICEG
ncbi:hypothetical protein B0H63DRAFT_479388 [Podospora didyma]|uniref:Uncharacterized protein n=1 Tax=Podospora didyma TaxID=330526 RepID=A0AAE0KKP3_9PEZI|nr:hypothetical protein B0H63DRAFT_479388 [Podospora didyma]